MDLNKNWTREDNDKMREFIKENKSPEFIRNYFKNDNFFITQIKNIIKVKNPQLYQHSKRK